MNMYIVGIIIGIIYAVIAGKLAERKGKDVPVWVLLGLGFGLIAIIILACSPDKTRRTHSSFDLRKAADMINANQKPICMKCGNTLTKGPVCDMCGYVDTMSSSTKSMMSSPKQAKEISKVPKYKCKGCEEIIDTVQCPWCGRKQYE